MLVDTPDEVTDLEIVLTTLVLEALMENATANKEVNHCQYHPYSPVTNVTLSYNS